MPQSIFQKRSFSKIKVCTSFRPTRLSLSYVFKQNSAFIQFCKFIYILNDFFLFHILQEFMFYSLISELCFMFISLFYLILKFKIKCKIGHSHPFPPPHSNLSLKPLDNYMKVLTNQ